MSHIIRQGIRIEVDAIEIDTIELGARISKQHKPFKAQWVKFPLRWAEALRRSKSVSTYQLALVILFEAFKRKHTGGEIILSSTVVGMPRCTKMRATKELVEFGLIETKQNGKQASRVSIIY